MYLIGLRKLKDETDYGKRNEMNVDFTERNMLYLYTTAIRVYGRL